MDPQIPDLAADRIDLLGGHLVAVADDPLFQIVEPTVIAFEQLAVMRDDLLQKVIEEPLKTRQPPLFGASYLVNKLLRLTAVVDQHDPFFVQRKGKGLVAGGKPFKLTSALVEWIAAMSGSISMPMSKLSFIKAHSRELSTATYCAAAPFICSCGISVNVSLIR